MLKYIYIKKIKMKKFSDTITINGNNLLKGRICPQGAKNESFQVLAAVLLTEEDVEIKNIPEILDIKNLFEIFKILGVKIKKIKKGHYIFNSKKITKEKINSKEFFEKFSKLRGSLMVSGALLARFGFAVLPTPGGDKIGIRPISTHIRGFLDLGAKYDKKSKKIILDKILSKVDKNKIILKDTSVTGTANIILASVLEKNEKKHVVEIYNAASEPYVQQLIKMLNSMGADIEGGGTNFITIKSVKKLSSAKHEILPDMIEIGSFICLAVATGDGVFIENAKKEHLGELTFDIFKKLGVNIKEIKKDDKVWKKEGFFIPRHKKIKVEKPQTVTGTIRTIQDDTWPKLSPDHLSSIISMLVFSKGIVTVKQRMFERRLVFCDVLNTMGADIIMSHHQEVTVVGNNRERELYGVEMVSPDIRAGMALLIAALSAKGQSKIHNATQIHRGYENIIERLKNIGADIK